MNINACFIDLSVLFRIDIQDIIAALLISNYPASQIGFQNYPYRIVG
jgi:hypothetical protein